MSPHPVPEPEAPRRADGADERHLARITGMSPDAARTYLSFHSGARMLRGPAPGGPGTRD